MLLEVLEICFRHVHVWCRYFSYIFYTHVWPLCTLKLYSRQSRETMRLLLNLRCHTHVIISGKNTETVKDLQKQFHFQTERFIADLNNARTHNYCVFQYLQKPTRPKLPMALWIYDGPTICAWINIVQKYWYT